MTSQASAVKPKASPSRARIRRPSLSNDEFLDKALDMFLDRGFDGASIEAITAEAGIAKRTVYMRYGDKELLFKAAVRRAIEEWMVPVERLRAAESDSLESSLLAIGKILVDNVLSPAGLRLLRLTNAESARMPDLSNYIVHEGQDRTAAYLADLFRRHLSWLDASFTQGEDAAEAFLHLVVGGPANSSAWGLQWERSAIEERTRYSVSLFLHGLKTQSVQARNEIVALKEELRQLRTKLSEAAASLEQVEDALNRIG